MGEILGLSQKIEKATIKGNDLVKALNGNIENTNSRINTMMLQLAKQAEKGLHEIVKTSGDVVQGIKGSIEESHGAVAKALVENFEKIKQLHADTTHSIFEIQRTVFDVLKGVANSNKEVHGLKSAVDLMHRKIEQASSAFDTALSSIMVCFVLVQESSASILEQQAKEAAKIDASLKRIVLSSEAQALQHDKLLHQMVKMTNLQEEIATNWALQFNNIKQDMAQVADQMTEKLKYLRTFGNSFTHVFSFYNTLQDEITNIGLVFCHAALGVFLVCSSLLFSRVLAFRFTIIFIFCICCTAYSFSYIDRTASLKAGLLVS